MAIGAVLSHRNFGSFIGSGRLCHGEAARAHQRSEYLSFAAAQCTYKKMIGSKLCLPCGSFSSGCVNQSSDRHQSKKNVHQSNSAFHIKVDSHLSNQLSKEFKGIYTRRRIRGCCLSSVYSDGNWVQPGKLNNYGFIDGQKLASKHSTVMRTRADFKSEEHEGSSEDVLLERVEPTKPWWNKFPKRWVMVLLCFAAFLLCNMDRVNMSIAILPMSKEFNWDSATVGLIQSSFFWGYLLTQVFIMIG